MQNAWINKIKLKKSRVAYKVRFIEPVTGKMPQKSFRRLEDAREYKATIDHQLAANSYHSPCNLAFDQWRVEFLEKLRSSKRSPLAESTIKATVNALDMFCKYCKPKKLEDLNYQAALWLMEKMLAADEEYSPFTINRVLRHLRAALSHSVAFGYISNNPLLGKKLSVRAELKELRIPTPAEVQAVLNACLDDRPLRLAIMIGFCCGLRLGEVSWLNWQDIDFDGSVLHVINRREHLTKTRRGRVVVLRRQLADLLADFQKDQVNGWIFVNPALFYRRMPKKLDKLLEKAAVIKFTFHDLRRSCNSYLLEAGTDPVIVRQILGHSSAAVNEKYYTGTLMQQQKNAAESMPELK